MTEYYDPVTDEFKMKEKSTMTEVEQQLLQRMQRLEKEVQSLKVELSMMDRRKS